MKVVDTTGDDAASALGGRDRKQGSVPGGSSKWDIYLPVTEIHYSPNQLDAASFLLDYIPDAEARARHVHDGSRRGLRRIELHRVTVPATATTLPAVVGSNGGEVAPTTLPATTTAPAVPAALTLGVAC